MLRVPCQDKPREYRESRQVTVRGQAPHVRNPKNEDIRPSLCCGCRSAWKRAEGSLSLMFYPIRAYNRQVPYLEQEWHLHRFL